MMVISTAKMLEETSQALKNGKVLEGVIQSSLQLDTAILVRTGMQPCSHF